MDGSWLAASDTGGELWADPSFWVNLGVAGAFLLLFATGRVHPQSTVDRLERDMARLIEERNQALAERDEMIGVMKDFTHTASAILQVDTQGRRSPKRRPTGGE